MAKRSSNLPQCTSIVAHINIAEDFLCLPDETLVKAGAGL